MAQRQSKNRDYYFRQVDFIFYREKQYLKNILKARTILYHFSQLQMHIHFQTLPRQEPCEI